MISGLVGAKDKDFRLSDEEVKTVRSGQQPLSAEELRGRPLKPFRPFKCTVLQEQDVVAALRKVGFGNLLIP